MTLEEVVALFRRSRRTIMRWVDGGKLPQPEAYLPMSWDRAAIRVAHKRIREETKNERRQRTKPRNGRRHRTREGGHGARS